MLVRCHVRNLLQSIIMNWLLVDWEREGYEEFRSGEEGILAPICCEKSNLALRQALIDFNCFGRTTRDRFVYGAPSVEQHHNDDSEPGMWYALRTVLTLKDAGSKRTIMHAK